MPNRIIKESIHGSEKLNSLSDFQYRLWVGLITYVDDYGRGDARPAIIKGTVFPLRDRLTVKSIQDALLALANAGCVNLYEVDGKPYLYFPNWEAHQRIQTKKSRFPAPRDSTVSHGDSPPESESESEYESNTKENICTEPQSVPVLALILKDETEYPVFQAEIDEYRALYPDLDVVQEYRKMRAWCLANAAKRKTRKGIRRFINGWLNRENDALQKGGKHGTVSTGTAESVSANAPADTAQWGIKYNNDC